MRENITFKSHTRMFGATFVATLGFCVALALCGRPVRAQSGVTGSFAGDMRDFVATPAVPGYEKALSEKIRDEVASLHPAVDNLGEVVVTLGSGAPHRLIVAPIDEPGYVVSGITDDGYLRLQRLPQSSLSLPPIFNELYSAQPVKVGTAGGKWIDGVVAGLSIHLQSGRADAPKASDLENMYVDIGASSAAEARKAGVDVLSPVAIDRRLAGLGDADLAGASVGDKFGAAAVLEMLREVDPSKIKGTLTVAFVAQQWVGARGLQRILNTVHADEMIYVGRLLPGGAATGMQGVHRAPRHEPGDGVLLGYAATNGIPAGLATDLKQLADANKIPLNVDYSAAIVPASDLPMPEMPARWVHLGIATAWSDTPAEEIANSDLDELEGLLVAYATGEAPD
ncbi:MAG TPA: hypothetical protein VHX49_05620, partial [Candidatus Acidoferrales bacterium]|nr:hypothetical protein [Candidatus Acidoferrales bacterium]